MSLDERKPERRTLSAQERRTLEAFKADVRAQTSPTFAEEMARRIDDDAPGHWYTIEDLDRRFGFTS